MNNEADSRRRRERGFTLLELVVVIAVLVVLILAVVLVIRPVEMSSRARDTARMSDLDAISNAIGHADAEGPSVESGGFDPDGSKTGTCVNQGDPTVYVSVPLSETPPNDLPFGWNYGQVSAANLQNIDGSGWLPVNFTAGGGTSPISALPIDVSNKFSSGFYYSYVCHSNGSFELNARMVSEDRRTAGPNDVQSEDGGDDRYVYEVGADLTLNPKAPVGYWSFGDVVSGPIANNATIGLEDMSVNNNFGTAKNADGSGMAFSQGVLGGAVSFDGTDDYVDIPINSELAFSGNEDETIMFWTKHGAGATNIIAAGNKYQRRVFEATILIIDNLSNYNYVNTTGSNDDAWHFVVYTKAGLDIRSYVDGVEIDLITMLNQGNNIDGSWWFGQVCSGSCGGRFYTGELDEIRMYERAMSPAEISYMYEALKP